MRIGNVLVTWWTVVAVLLLSKSNAQLTSPTEDVCLGNDITFICQQNGTLSRWTINLPSTPLTNIVLLQPVGTTLTFQRDPGFHFQIHIISNTSSGITTQLNVTAVRQLDGVEVVCDGASGSFMSVIRVASVDFPPAPSGVMTLYDNYTRTGASVTIIWSPSEGAEIYFISITSLSGEAIANFTTTESSLQLREVEYNVNFTITITAANCVRSNSTTLAAVVAGCSPPLLSNGGIQDYLNGSIGSLLMYDCRTGYLPQDRMTSECVVNSGWIPPPRCVLADCGTPLASSGVVFEQLNSTEFASVVIFRCQDGLKPDDVVTAVCGSGGVWSPNPAHHVCVNQSVAICSAPSVSPDVHIPSPFYNIYREGVNITIQCRNQSRVVLTSFCRANGSWSPSPSELNCDPSLDMGTGCREMLSNTTQVAITAVVCSVAFFLFGILVGVLCHRWAVPAFMKPYNKKHSNETEHQHSHSDRPAAVTAPVLYEEVKLSSDPPHSEQNIELQENAAYGPI